MNTPQGFKAQLSARNPLKWFRPRFGLRALIVLTLISCVILTWVGYRIRSFARQQAIVAKFESNGVYATYERGNVISLQPFGIVTDDDLVHLRGLPELELLFLQDTQVTDAGLVHLKELGKLRWLVLFNRKITDSGLEQLKLLPNLRYLYLDGTLITNEGLLHLVEMTSLEHLSLGATQVTDDGVRKLRQTLRKTEILD
jgi:hypothetical protein